MKKTAVDNPAKSESEPVTRLRKRISIRFLVTAFTFLPFLSPCSGIEVISSDTKALVSSGYSDSPVVSDFKTYGFYGVLNKPYGIPALRECLKTLPA